MKTAAVVVFLALWLVSSFQDATAQDDKPQGFCSEYQKPPSDCDKKLHPICGTNNKTYDNKCFFCKAVWENLGSLCFKEEGKC